MRVSKRSVNRCAAVVAAVGFMSAGARAATISIDFAGTAGNGTQTAMGASEVAGVGPFAASNWNSFTTGVQATPVALNDSSGGATTATANWTSNNLWTTPAADTPGDLRMMRGYLDSSDTSTTSVTVAGLPASITSGPYSVILYYDGDNGGNNRVGKYSITGNPTGNASFWALDAANATFNGTYILAQSPIDPIAGGGAIDSNPTAALTVPAGNFMVFTGLTGDTFTLTAQSSVASDTTNRSAVEGIQIVSGTVPEPTGLGLLGLGATAFFARRRR
jgi:hypothetical protein